MSPEWNTCTPWSGAPLRVCGATSTTGKPSPAAEALIAHVQQRTGRHDLAATSFWQQIFSEAPPNTGEPRLRWPGDPTNQSVKTMNSGLRFFAPGVQMTIRNTSAHGTDEMTAQDAFERLGTLSLLAGSTTATTAPSRSSHGEVCGGGLAPQTHPAPRAAPNPAASTLFRGATAHPTQFLLVADTEAAVPGRGSCHRASPTAWFSTACESRLLSLTGQRGCRRRLASVTGSSAPTSPATSAVRTPPLAVTEVVSR
ncbi:TIGR02391 family protein [Streptomyces sp. NPDC012794]|uniref:TIGR02391 family protein n=1 Tax=Streptomyces sp. NPDC012794 TaxID=3364850 RepID=UPI0036B60173